MTKSVRKKKMKACRNKDATANCCLCNSIVFDKTKAGNVVQQYYYIAHSGEAGDKILDNHLVIVICKKCFQENAPIEFMEALKEK